MKLRPAKIILTAEADSFRDGSAWRYQITIPGNPIGRRIFATGRNCPSSVFEQLNAAMREAVAVESRKS